MQRCYRKTYRNVVSGRENGKWSSIQQSVKSRVSHQPDRSFTTTTHFIAKALRMSAQPSILASQSPTTYAGTSILPISHIRPPGP